MGFEEIKIESRLEAVDFYKKLGYALVNEEVVRSGSFDCIRMNKYL